MNNPRINQAILIAPLSVYPVFVVSMLVTDPPSWALAPLLGFFFALPVAYFGMLVIGIPSLALLVHIRATRWWQLTLVGTLGGGCMWGIAGKDMLSLGNAYGAVFGAVVAGTTWYIAFRRKASDAPDSGLQQQEVSPQCETQA
jgi:hypothetical protein